ncbi:MAG: 2-succinyl-6-hydroxy-2,4-cyclohexadiene-1-carboxylate synthase [candidate division Zixibacteria bacterium]|nr:2-succinyl-6-hydroxy-2,4-cyclohexadiene-1-carboxylate synthase [candidate division Zixibacteria bacterium]
MAIPLSFSYTCSDPAATTVLYLHGFLGCGEDWSDVALRIGSQFSHLTVDLPGHGPHPQDAAPDYSMATSAQHLIRLLDHLRLDSCDVVAYSMGGRLALYLAVHFPDRFRRLVVESSSPGLKTVEERTERCRRDNQLADSLEKQSFELFLNMWYGQPLFATMDRTGDRFASLIGRRRRGKPLALARSLRDMGTGAQPSLWNRLTELAMPILFLAGEKDRKFSRLAADMAHLCPQGELAILAEAGHNVHFEQPERLADEIRRFLTQQE